MNFVLATRPSIEIHLQTPYNSIKIYFTAEIGGLLALMLGASILTLVEVFDFFLYNCCSKCDDCYRHRKRKRYGRHGNPRHNNHVAYSPA